METKPYVRYKNGVVLGKFMPPHNGHLFMIDTAASLCEHLIVLVYSLTKEPIPGYKRKDWLKSIYKDNPNVEIVWVQDNTLPQYPDEHVDFWQIWTNQIKYWAGASDVLFGSEDYVRTLADHCQIKHHIIDLYRTTVPTSGTDVRNKPFTNWDYINPVVRPYFNKKIALMGPESAGKSTLTRQLARIFNTNFVDEFGRNYWERLRSEDRDPKVEDFFSIMLGHFSAEGNAKQLANKVLFCDTEYITTRVFMDIYGIDTELVVENFLDRASDHDMYLLIYPDQGWIDDGTRELESKQVEHFHMLEESLKERGKLYVTIKGNDKLGQCTSLVKQFIDQY